ncbi:hypothetical protein ACFE04_007886 [Oxalis oulophora]
MSNIGTSKGILEIFKFGVYVSVPIVLMYTFANNSKNLQKFMGNRSYVVYPEHTEPILTNEEVREGARELAHGYTLVMPPATQFIPWAKEEQEKKESEQLPL